MLKDISWNQSFLPQVAFAQSVLAQQQNGTTAEETVYFGSLTECTDHHGGKGMVAGL